MKSTLLYGRRAQYALKELHMAALIYLSDELVDLQNRKDWRIQLMRDASKDLENFVTLECRILFG